MVDFTVILAYAAGIILLFILGRSLVIPMKIISKLIYNGILGGMALIAINLLGELIGFTLPLNILTVFIAGILGLPGVVLLIILKLLFKV